MPQASKIISFDGVGTHWECEVLDFDFSNSSLNKIKKNLVSKAADFTNKYSRFDEKSLIGILNTSHEINNPSDEIINMFNFAHRMYDETDGAFNISVGGELHAMGYGSTKLAANAQHDFWKKTVISHDKIMTPKNSVIDFGGFGKGWLIDEFVEIFIQNNINEFIINGGGDLFVHSNSPIEIMLEHPLDPTKSVGQTRITSGALAASSIIKRAWENEGGHHHHIVDPATGKPSCSGVISAFVKSDSAAIADVMATVLIIRPDLDIKLSKKYDLKTILLFADQFKS